MVRTMDECHFLKTDFIVWSSTVQVVVHVYVDLLDDTTDVLQSSHLHGSKPKINLWLRAATVALVVKVSACASTAMATHTNIIRKNVASGELS